MNLKASATRPQAPTLAIALFIQNRLLLTSICFGELGFSPMSASFNEGPTDPHFPTRWGRSCMEPKPNNPMFLTLWLMFVVSGTRCWQEEKKFLSAVITWLHCSCKTAGANWSFFCLRKDAIYVKCLGSGLHSQNGCLPETLHNTDSQKSIRKSEIWDCFASLRRLSGCEISAMNSGSLILLCIWSH